MAGLTAVLGGFSQIALGTVIGSAIFLLTAALGISSSLVVVAVGLLIWLYRSSPLFLNAEGSDDDDTTSTATSRMKAQSRR
jgi:Ca2+/Na+ antiporter